MHGWMDRPMDARMDEWIDGERNGYMNRRVMDEQTGGCVDGQMNSWVNFLKYFACGMQNLSSLHAQEPTSMAHIKNPH